MATNTSWRRRMRFLLGAIAAVGLCALGIFAPLAIAEGPLSPSAVEAPDAGANQELTASDPNSETPVPAPEAAPIDESDSSPSANATEPSLAVLVPPATPAPTAIPFTSRLTSVNGRFLLLNMHGVLFHSDLSDLAEEIAYAQWMNAGAIRVFATDNNTRKNWGGAQVGNRIAEIAPTLRARGVKLIVALVNNHRPVPGEPLDSFGPMDGFDQLLLPFYTTNWPKAYLPFVRDLITTVQARGVGDVILAWEPGNELHATLNPAALIPFMTGAAAEIRKLDQTTPLLPGTISVEHTNPGNPHSPIGRWLYCEAPIDAYTLHSYDWVSPDNQGISRISFDFDEVVSQPCPNGRRLPVLVEELGTSRAIAGVYAASEEDKRVQQEISQMRYVLSHPGVIGIGAWNAESPRVRDHIYYDNQRGLTSYGPLADGFGSCYDGANGFRCRVEQALRGLPALP